MASTIALCIAVFSVVVFSRTLAARGNCELSVALNAIRRRLIDDNTDYYLDLAPSDKPIVDIFLVPRELIGANSVRNELDLPFFMQMSWTDERLAWAHLIDANLSTVIGADQCLPIGADPAARIWTPSINVRERTYVKHPNGATFLVDASSRVCRDGHIEWNGTFVDTLSCHMSSYRFPFDRHRCSFTVAASERLQLKFDDATAHRFNSKVLTEYASTLESTTTLNNYRSGEFAIAWLDAFKQPDVRVFESATLQRSYLVYRVRLERASLRGVGIWIFPVTTITLASLVGLYLGADGHERYALGAAVLVAVALNQNHMAGELSANGDAWPVIGFAVRLLHVMLPILSSDHHCIDVDIIA